jgi:hypothetical protein
MTFSHIHILYLVWFIFSIIIFLPSFPFLKWLRKISMFDIHECIESTSTIFIFLYPLHLPSPPTHPPLTWTLSQSCPSLFKCLLIFEGFSPWYFTCKYTVLSISLTPSSILPYPLPLNLYFSTVLSTFHCVLFPHRCDVLQYYSLSIILFFLP